MALAFVRSDERRRVLHAPPAVANDGSLPADILYEVLLRLPANVLCRLRVICRSWLSLTSDPIFAMAHFSRHILVVGLCDVTGLPGHSRREVQFVDLSGNIVKRICITGRAWDGHKMSAQPFLRYTRSTKKSCALNPSTGAFTVLPANIAAEHKNKSSPILSLSLLGRIPSTGEDKVLRIHWYLTNSEPEQTCEVKTVGNSGSDGRWMVRATPLVRVAATPLHGLVVNGIAYFLLEVYRWHAKYGEIASFDLATEEWRPDTLQGPLSGLLPVADEEDRICFHLSRLNRSLVAIYYTRGRCYGDRLMDLWFLVDIDKGLWTKLYTLQCTPIFRHGLSSPLEVLNDGRILLWVDRCIRVYDPKTNISTDLCKLENFSGVCIYQGSLLCSDLQD